MDVLHHQSNGASRKGHRQVRQPSQGSSSEAASDSEQIHTREGPHIPLPFANSATHYVPDSDDSDTESRPMLINTEAKEDPEAERIEEEEEGKANCDIPEETGMEQDAPSESGSHASPSALSGSNTQKFASEREHQSSEEELPMDTAASADDKEEIHKDPMSPEIQVVSSGQAFKPTLGTVSGVPVAGTPVLSPPPTLPFATWSAWQSGILPAFGMGSSGMPLTTPTNQDLLEPGTSVTVPLTVCQESEGVLVVRLRWREKTYSGSLIDLGQHNWAPPKLSGSSSENPLALQSLYNNETENQTVDIDDDDKETVSPTASTGAEAQPSTVTDTTPTSVAPCEGADTAVQPSSNIAATPAVNQSNLLKVPKPDTNYSDISEDDDDMKDPSTSTLAVSAEAAPSSAAAVGKRPYTTSVLDTIPGKKEHSVGDKEAMDTSTPQQKHLGKKTADGKVQGEEVTPEYPPSPTFKEEQPAALHSFARQKQPVSSISANVGDQRSSMPQVSSSGSAVNKNSTLSRENSLSNLDTLASVASSQDTTRADKSRSVPEGFPPSATKDDDRDSSSTLTASPDHTTTNAPIGYSGSRQRADTDRMVISETGKATVGYSMPGADTGMVLRQNEGNTSDSSGSGSVAPSDRRKKSSKHRQAHSREVLQRASPAPIPSAIASNEKSATGEGRRKLLATTVPVDHPVSPGPSQKRSSTLATEPHPHRHERHHSHHHPSRHHAHDAGSHSAIHGSHSHRDSHQKDHIEHRHEMKQGNMPYGSDMTSHIHTMASSSSPSTHIVSSTKTASLPVAPLSANTPRLSPNPSHESGGSPQSLPEAYRSHSKPPTGTPSGQVAPSSATGIHSSLAQGRMKDRKRHSRELPPGVKKPCSPDSTGSGGMVSGRVSSSDALDVNALRTTDMQGHPPNQQPHMAGFVYDPSMPIPVEWQMLSYQNQQKKKTGNEGKPSSEGIPMMPGQRPPSAPGSGTKDQSHHHHSRHHQQRSHAGSDSARHPSVKLEGDPTMHHSKHHTSSHSQSHTAMLTPDQHVRIRSQSAIMQPSGKRAEQRLPTSPSPTVIGHQPTIIGSSPAAALQTQGVPEVKESGRGESKPVERHEGSSIHRPPGRPRVRGPSLTTATNRSPTEAKEKPQSHQAGLVTMAPPNVAGVPGMWAPEMMQYGGMLLSGYPTVGTSQASVAGAIPFSMVGAPQGVYSMSGGAWHINPLMAYGSGAMEQKAGEGSKAEHVPVVRATTTEPSKAHSSSTSRSSVAPSQNSSGTGVQGRQEQQAAAHSQGIFPFGMQMMRGGKDSPSPLPVNYLQGNVQAYLQAQMQQQQQQQQQQQHASAQQQRSDTSSSRALSGMQSKASSQEKPQQQQSVVSQQQKAVEQAAAAQQPLMAPGVMTQPLAVQMAGMIPMATQEDLAKLQLEYFQRNGMQPDMVAFQQQMLHQMQQLQQQQQQQQPNDVMAMYQQLFQASQQQAAAVAAAQQHHQQQQASAQQQAQAQRQQQQQQQVAAVTQLHPTAVHAGQAQEIAVQGVPMQFFNPIQPAFAGSYIDQSIVPSTLLQLQQRPK